MEILNRSNSPEEGQRFAEGNLRYFPRRVTLAPNEAQTIRVQVTRTGNLEQGEYRSHMYFRAVEEQTALGQEEAQEAEGISINIKTVFGISIPIIIRQGESTTQINLTDIQLNREGENPKLSMVLNRSGNMSVYGNIKVDHISPEGVTTEVGMVKGVSVYTPNNKRNFSFELRNAGEVDLSYGKIERFHILKKKEKLWLQRKFLEINEKKLLPIFSFFKNRIFSGGFFVFWI